MFPQARPAKPRPREGLAPNPKLKLFDQCREVMRFQHLSYRTEQTYLEWIKRYVVFCRGGEPGARQEPCPTGPREDAEESKLPTPNIQHATPTSEQRTANFEHPTFNVQRRRGKRQDGKPDRKAGTG